MESLQSKLIYLQKKRNEENEFQKWYAKYSTVTGINPDPDEPRHFYDYRSFWKEDRGRTPIKTSMHLPDKYKLIGHPTFSLESIYAVPPKDLFRYVNMKKRSLLDMILGK